MISWNVTCVERFWRCWPCVASYAKLVVDMALVERRGGETKGEWLRVARVQLIYCKVIMNIKTKGNVGYPGRVPEIYLQHIPPIIWIISWLYNGNMGVIFREQLLGYPAKATQNFPLSKHRDYSTGFT